MYCANTQIMSRNVLFSPNKHPPRSSFTSHIGPLSTFNCICLNRMQTLVILFNFHLGPNTMVVCYTVQRIVKVELGTGHTGQCLEQKQVWVGGHTHSRSRVEVGWGAHPPTGTHAQSLLCPFRDETHNDPHANCILMRTFVCLFSCLSNPFIYECT